MKRPADTWFAQRNLSQCRAWLAHVEKLDACGFGTPKSRYIGNRMRQRITELGGLELVSSFSHHQAVLGIG
jgi:hypothetical protein